MLRADRGAGHGLVVGLLLFPLAVALLTGLLGVPLIDALLLAGLIVLLPLLGVAQARAVDRIEPFERIPAYVGSAVAIGILAGLSLAAGLRQADPAALGLVALPAAVLLVWTGAVLAAGGLVVAGGQLLRRRLGFEESRVLVDLLPTTTRERWMFAGLSCVAGLGEEVAFRGYAIDALSGVPGGLWAAAVVTSVAFGTMHAYQDALGVVRATALGMLLAVPVVVTGSLWPSVTAHVIIDLVGGLWIGPRLAGVTSRA